MSFLLAVWSLWAVSMYKCNTVDSARPFLSFCSLSVILSFALEPTVSLLFRWRQKQLQAFVFGNKWTCTQHQWTKSLELNTRNWLFTPSVRCHSQFDTSIPLLCERCAPKAPQILRRRRNGAHLQTDLRCPTRSTTRLRTKKVQNK